MLMKVLNSVSEYGKLSAGRKDGRIETETEVLTTECEHGSTVTENNISDSIRTTNLARVKAREGTENINVKNTNNRDVQAEGDGEGRKHTESLKVEF